MEAKESGTHISVGESNELIRRQVALALSSGRRRAREEPEEEEASLQQLSSEEEAVEVSRRHQRGELRPERSTGTILSA
jgi:hypothetical protein